MPHPDALWCQNDILAEPLEPHASHRRPPSLRATVSAILVVAIAIFALLGLGRLLVHQWPVEVEIVGDGSGLQLTADGTSRRVNLNRPIVAVRPVAPMAFRREFQVDGSDSTNMLTFSPRYFAEFGLTPYYQAQALLREEWRYSQWTGLTVLDGSGQLLLRQDRPPDEVYIPLPPRFQLRIGLERPEIPRVLELIDADERPLLLEVNRNDRYIRLGSQRSPSATDLARWYFPRDLRPPLATLTDLLTRAAALALGLVLVAVFVAAVVPSPVRWLPGSRVLAVGTMLGLVWFLAGSWFVATVLFDRAPHILDAVSYLFQAKTFASGALWAPPPLVNDAFPIPFSTVYHERWFVQYPPGTALTLLPGILAGVPWLVHPLMAAGAVVLVALTVRRQYGPGTALLVVLLMVTSPFVLLTAGSFLSHIPALFFAMVALYAATRYGERPGVQWAALAAGGLGLALLTREMVAVLFGVMVVVAGATHAGPERGRAMLLDGMAAGAVFLAAVAAFLGYNAAVTGEPFVLPRLLVNGADRWGFGPGIGFYTEHTVASGLVNSEEQLVSLGFSLAGWPFGFSLALPLLPLLLRRASSWDVAHGGLVAFYVVAYAAYFYHGITFGPRYYFEAVPSLLILTVRGFAALTDTVSGWLASLGYRQPWWRARQAAGLLLGVLMACNAVYFLPRQATLYAGFTGLPGGGPVLDENIGRDLSGRVSRLENALVITDEWWFHMMYYAALNCPRLDCPTVFAHAPDEQARELLIRMYADRQVYTVEDRRGVLTIVPARP